MKILIPTWQAAHHVSTNSELGRVIGSRGHEVDLLVIPFPAQLAPRLFDDWMEEFRKASPRALLELISYARSWRAPFDLIIADPTMFCVQEFSFKTKIPWMQYGNLPLFYVDKTCKLYLQASIPSFEPDVPYKNLQFVGPNLGNLSETRCKPWKWDEVKASKLPIVHVTQGTISHDPSELINPTISACGSRFFCVSWAFQHKYFMQDVDIFVTNGGFGGVSCALAAGKPIILAGTTEDKQYVGERVEKAGNGIYINNRRPSAEAIREALREITFVDRYKRRAQDLKEECSHYSLQQGIDSIEKIFGNAKAA